MPFACAARISARPSPNVHGARAGRVARRDATRAPASAAASVSMWPASASSASEPARMPAATSPAIKPTIRPSAIASKRRSRAREWSCACIARSLSGLGPGPREREALRRCRVREEQEIGEPRRIELAEILARELDVRALERLEIVRQLERAAVGGALHASRDRREDRHAGELEADKDEQRDRQVARRERSERRPEHEHGYRGAGHRERGQLRRVAVAAVTELVRDRHAAKLTALAMAASAVAVFVLSAALGTVSPRRLPVPTRTLARPRP